MIDTVIFDLDGTLVDTLGDIAASCNHVMETNGFPTHTLEVYRYYVGNGISKLIERALPEAYRNPDFIHKARKEFIAYYSEHLTDLSLPYEGIEEVLSELNRKGVMLGVASNKYHEGTCRIVSHYFPSVPFKAVFGQRDRIPVKPEPQIVREILSVTGSRAEECLYIGDSDVDMLTARRAGVLPIGASWGFRTAEELSDAGAFAVIDRPREILRFLPDPFS